MPSKPYRACLAEPDTNRGLSFIESVGIGGDATLVRRGLPKFFDFDAQAMSQSVFAPESETLNP